ncbi:hypothetical protein EJ06DRAFT_169886 [Trichodelitschia bisporula]|uniref:Inhibitor I9 domain-containing protein n=1 Tax=Trichodelitschia bisporula TaxID=703511 RepID=A0A6G1HN87_9PEZI|nr:hypothetical protein EJ06DRAFT_169886 [Trichodelitschia bisporula]
MKFFGSFIVLLFALITGAAAQLQAYIVSFPKDTPDSVVKDAKQAILDAGGKITHEYTIIKGFAAQAPASAMSTVSIQSSQYHPTIEVDGVASINVQT